MSLHRWNGVAAALALGALLFGGCGRHEPPAALTEQEIPAAMDKAFQKAKPEVRALAERAVRSFRGTKYAQAAVELQALCERKDLKPAQREVASQFLLTVNQQLQAAQVQGDQTAAEFMQLQRRNK
jgi:hypothetical protein